MASCTTDPDGGSERPRRGRPVQIAPEEREEIVLDATQALLAERRLADVTMSAIAARAGMSKRTLYSMFDSREALLEACITRLNRTLFRPLTPDDRALPLSRRLRLLLTFNSVPGTRTDALELLRALIAEARAFPDLARRSCRNGRRALERNVAVELHEAVRCREVTIPDDRIALAAEMLVDMVFENPVSLLLDPDAPRPTVEKQAMRRDWAIRLFLTGLGYRDDGRN